MNVSVIIVNYNTTDLTLACIASVYKHTLQNSIEVILVDNASPDQSITNGTQIYPDLKLILNPTNSGFGSACNRGIEIAAGDYIFLLNSDALLISDAINTFFNFMERSENSNVACCGGALIQPDGRAQVSYGNFPSIAAGFSALGPAIFYKTFYDRRLSAGVKIYKEHPYNVDYISGADMFIRSSALKETGNFDEDFFLYFEETELSYRLYKRGYKSMVLPAVKIIHLEYGSQNIQSIITNKTFQKSMKMYFKKCHNKIYVIIAVFLYRFRVIFGNL